MKLIIILAAFTMGHASLLTHLFVPLKSRSSKSVHILNKHFVPSPIHLPYALQAEDTNAYFGVPIQNPYGQIGKPSFVDRLKFIQAAREKYASKHFQTNMNDTKPNSYNSINDIEGEVKPTSAHIGYYYVGEDGKIYFLRYLADTNGYVPIVDIKVTPTPIPAEFVKGLEKIGHADVSSLTNNEDKKGPCYEDKSGGKCEPGRMFSSRISNRNSIFKKPFYPLNKLNQNIGY